MSLYKADDEENRSHAERGYVPLSGTGVLSLPYVEACPEHKRRNSRSPTQYKDIYCARIN